MQSYKNIEDIEESNKTKINFEIIEEKNEEIKKITKDIEMINEIFRNLDSMIESQSESIVELDKNVSIALESTEKSVEILTETQSLNNNTSNKKLKFLGLGLIGLAINAPITLAFGLKIGLISGLSTLGVTSVATLIK